MLTALCDKLSILPCMRLEDMVDFLRGEFEVEVTRFSIRRALKDVDWSKKATQNVAQERNPDLRDEYMHDVSSFHSDKI
jgi:transposase